MKMKTKITTLMTSLFTMTSRRTQAVRTPSRSSLSITLKWQLAKNKQMRKRKVVHSHQTAIAIRNKTPSPQRTTSIRDSRTCFVKKRKTRSSTCMERLPRVKPFNPWLPAVANRSKTVVKSSHCPIQSRLKAMKKRRSGPARRKTQRDPRISWLTVVKLKQLQMRTKTKTTTNTRTKITRWMKK